MADSTHLRVVRLAPGWWLDLAGTTVLTTPSPGRAARPGDADVVLGSAGAVPADLQIEALDGAWVIRFEATAIGVGRSAALAQVEDLDLALVDEGAAVEGLHARFVLPSTLPGVHGPRGVAVAPGEVATFTGRGDSLYVYSVEPWPGGVGDRWGWLRRFGGASRDG